MFPLRLCGGGVCPGAAQLIIKKCARLISSQYSQPNVLMKIWSWSTAAALRMPTAPQKGTGQIEWIYIMFMEPIKYILL